MQPLTKSVVTNEYVPGGIAPVSIEMVLFDVATGIPPGKGLRGLYQSCCMFMMGFDTTPVNEQILPKQPIVCVTDDTDVVGAIVFIMMAKVCIIEQLVTASVATRL